MDAQQKGKFIKHIACTNPERSLDGKLLCGSSDALAVYRQPDGSYNATCFSCGYFDSSPPIGSKVSSQTVRPSDGPHAVRTMLTKEQVSECPSLPLSDRGIKKSTSEFYEVKTILNGLDGQTPVAWCFPYYKYNNTLNSTYNSSPSNPFYLSGYKKRIVSDKIFTAIEDIKETMLFGQQKFLSGGKTLYITEGEIDCLSVFQTLKDNSTIQGYTPCVVSLPSGANNAAAVLANNQSFLDKFKEIRLVFDNDEQGKKAVEAVCSFLDLTKVSIVELDLKDANEMVMQNRSRELLWACLTGAKPYVPSGITTSRTLLTEALRPSERGYDWPWPSLTALTSGIRPGLYGIGAGVGVGKTEFFHELAYHISAIQNRPIGLFLLEEAPQRTLRILAGRALNKPLHRPDIEVDERMVREKLEQFSREKERVFCFDHKGSRDWDTIFTQCKYLAAVHGVRSFFIDPLTAIISHEENTDRALHKLMDDMSILRDRHGCAVFFSSHLNEPPRDKVPHEEGGRVKEAHFAGSRAMIRFSNYIFALERNKQDPDIVQRNTTTFRVLKDREFGTASGETFEIYYDSTTGRYLEPSSDF